VRGKLQLCFTTVLKHFPGAEADYIKKRMLDDTDAVYGEGLRHVKAFVNSRGTAAWLDYITNNDKKSLVISLSSDNSWNPYIDRSGRNHMETSSRRS